VAWLGLFIETLVCLVLVGVIVAVVLQARHNVLAGPAAIAIATTVVGIVRYRWRSSESSAEQRRRWR
jgi:hypothetical protein